MREEDLPNWMETLRSLGFELRSCKYDIENIVKYQEKQE